MSVVGMAAGLTMALAGANVVRAEQRAPSEDDGDPRYLAVPPASQGGPAAPPQLDNTSVGFGF